MGCLPLRRDLTLSENEVAQKRSAKRKAQKKKRKKEATNFERLRAQEASDFLCQVAANKTADQACRRYRGMWNTIYATWNAAQIISKSAEASAEGV